MRLEPSQKMKSQDFDLGYITSGIKLLFKASSQFNEVNQEIPPYD